MGITVGNALTFEEMFNTARKHQDEGEFVEAEEIYRRLLKVDRDPMAINYYLGLALLATRRAEEALPHLQTAMRVAEESGATDRVKNTISLQVANAVFPGTGYYQIIEKLGAELKPRGYLEIGVNTGVSLALIKAPAVAIGVDPEPRVAHLNDNAVVYPLTSDAFFEQGLVARNHPGFKLDLAFIDGLHAFFQVLRDFINIEAMAEKNAIVLLHDIYPPTRWSASPTHNGGHWAGDGWKIFFFLHRLRPDLELSLIRAHPTGLGVVRHLNPADTVLREHYGAVVAEAAGMDYSYFETYLPEIRVVDHIEDVVDFAGWRGWEA
ncbi:MAG: class I SAM-dependent methyltransferase [Alphaproteobacteria bacterium]